MPWTKKTFQNKPSTATPLTAAELNNLGDQYAAARADAVADVEAAIGDTETEVGAALANTFVASASAGVAASTGFLRLAGTVPGSVPVVKPSGDGRAGVWEMTHNDATGYLFHLLSGASMSHTAALLGLGVDNDGIGIVIPNKKSGRGIVGDQRATVDNPEGYWLHATQRSTAAPLVRLEQQGASVAPVLQLLSFSGFSGRLLHIVNADGEVGSVHGSNGRMDWFRDISIRNQASGEVVSYLSLSTSSAANAANTRKTFLAPSDITMFGASGSTTFYPYRWTYASSSLAFQTASAVTPATAGSPHPSDVSTWNTRLSIGQGANGLVSVVAGKIRVDDTGIGFFGTTTRAQSTGWGLPTGSPLKTAFDISTVTLPELAARVAALIIAFHANAGYGALAS